MAKKDFTSMDTSNRVRAQIETATATEPQKKQKPAGAEEKKERAAKMKTQGRAGCKAVRINMAFSTENHQFIKVMSQATGLNMTEFTNKLIEAYRNEHPELMQKANEFISIVNSGAFSAVVGGEEE